MLNKLLNLLGFRLALENGLADSEYKAIEQYQNKINRMNEIQLCEETGTTHRVFVLNNLTKEDLKHLAMQNKIREVSGYYFG